MTLAEIELDVFRRLDYADAPPPSVKARVDGFINQRHAQIVSSDRMRSLRLGQVRLTTIADRFSYGLPFGCARVIRILDLAGQYELATRTLEWFRQQSPDPSTLTGTPYYWVPMGQPANTVPLHDGTTDLWIAATAKPPGNSVTFSLVLVGLYNGYPGQTITVAPTLNADPLVRKLVTIPAGFIVQDIRTFTSNKPLADTVALFDSDVGGIIVSQIAEGRSTARYARIGLAPTPAAAQEYMIEYEHELMPLTAPQDVPLLPEDFHDLLCMYARLDEYEYKSDDRWQTLMAQVQDRLKDLRAFVENHDTYKAHAVPDSRRMPYGRLPWNRVGA